MRTIAYLYSLSRICLRSYGLFISKMIVESHGGTVHAESEGQGKGSTFVVEFPVG